MKLQFTTAVALSALIALPAAALAENALDTLQSMHKTAAVDWPVVPQDTTKAEAIKKNLAKVTMPAGFHINL